LERGRGKMLIDFEEYEASENQVLCVQPGQVHAPINYSNACAWVLAVDTVLVKDEYKEIFRKLSFLKNKIELSKDNINELRSCALLINNRLKSEKNRIEQSILHDLISSYIGLIADVYQKGFPILTNNRFAAITFQFKTLLSENYQTLKRPSQYASKLNISAVYLNEAVKKTTGLTVSNCILNEIVLQAKRLLFYTKLSVKQIAITLGYEDWAYFTRLFTKATQLSPSQFRKKYLK
jgi:AraC-like DNA-binding protein